MIRFLLRFVGLLLLALAFIFLVYDGIRSISDGGMLLTKASDIWNILNDRTLAAFQTWVEGHARRRRSGRSASRRSSISPPRRWPVFWA